MGLLMCPVKNNCCVIVVCFIIEWLCSFWTALVLQIFALFLRPKKEHKLRFYWNIYHHGVGYAILTLGIINVFKGLNILDPEKKWKSTYVSILIVLGAIAVLLELFTWIVVWRRRSSRSTKPYAWSIVWQFANTRWLEFAGSSNTFIVDLFNTGIFLPLVCCYSVYWLVIVVVYMQIHLLVSYVF